MPNLAYVFLTYIGTHGWDDTDPSPNSSSYIPGPVPDVRGIFYAVGPAFARSHGRPHPHIKLTDEYQVLQAAIGVHTGRGHNGTWERVEGLFNQQWLGRYSKKRANEIKIEL